MTSSFPHEQLRVSRGSRISRVLNILTQRSLKIVFDETHSILPLHFVKKILFSPSSTITGALCLSITERTQK